MHLPSRLLRRACACAILLASAGPAPAQAPAAALYLMPGAATAGATVAVGPDGMVHMAAAGYGEAGGVTYATCTGSCGEDASWTRTEIPVPGAIRAELALTPDGAPRLLVIATADDNPGGRVFLYAECNPRGFLRADAAGCSDPQRWTLSRVASSHESAMGDFFERLLPQRIFALDPAGRPRFVFTDSDHFAEPDHYGVFYMSCDAACTDPGSWTETDLANHMEYRTEQFTRPVLAIGPSGAAHMLAWVYGFEPDGSAVPNDLFYYECSAGCTDKAGWRRVAVINPGSGTYPSPTWDLAIDARGRPRAAVFVAGAPTEADLAYSLIYLWCDADCTSDTGWQGWLVLEESYGEGPALALDAAGRPQIALLSPDAQPVLAVCSAGCETDDPAWEASLIEGEADMAADRPMAIPFTCDGELWNALMPDLALAPNGRAYAAYDVSVQARCLYHDYDDPEWEITAEFHEIWRGARIADLPPK